MHKIEWKKGCGFVLLLALVLSSLYSPVQTARAAKKTRVPKTSEMNKQNFVLIKGGTFQMGSLSTENWRTKIAQEIKPQLGADLFEIKTKTDLSCNKYL